jgi:hypothetical protein
MHKNNFRKQQTVRTSSVTGEGISGELCVRSTCGGLVSEQGKTSTFPGPVCAILVVSVLQRGLLMEDSLQVSEMKVVVTKNPL